MESVIGLWAAALDSGDYPQSTKGVLASGGATLIKDDELLGVALRDERGYTAEGVLAMLGVKSGVTPPPIYVPSEDAWLFGTFENLGGGSCVFLQDVIVRWAQLAPMGGMAGKQGGLLTLGGVTRPVSMFSDEGTPFPIIAAALREQYQIPPVPAEPASPLVVPASEEPATAPAPS